MDILSKKLLLDMSNNAVAFNGGQGVGTSTTIYGGFPYSFLCTFEATQEELSKLTTGTSNADFLLMWIKDSGDNRLCLGFRKRGSGIAPSILLCNSSATSNSTFYMGFMTPADIAGKHNLAFICRSFAAGVIDCSFYLDGVSVSIPIYGGANATTNTFDVSEYRCAVSNYYYGSVPQTWTPRFKISRMQAFNFDASAPAAPYKIDDYNNGRDIPSGVNAILDLNNNLSGSTWTDDSGNANDMTLSGDYEITDE